MTFIAVICGLKSEAAAVRAAIGEDQRIRVGVSGANAQRAEEIAAAFCAEGARAILSIGVSGGLDPELRAGKLVIGDKTITAGDCVFESDNQLFGAATNTLQDRTFVIGALFGSNEIVASAAGKKKLRERYQCLAVDMESHGAARAAAAANVPFLAIRAIADPADQALPKAALSAVAPDGSTRVTATLFAALRDPKQFPKLLEVGAHSNAALKTLRRDLGSLFRRLFVALNL